MFLIFQQFNMLELESEMIQTNHWSEKAINQVEIMMSNAESLIFHYDCHATKQHLFGAVEAISCTGKKVFLHEVLENLEEAVKCTANFEKGEFSLFIPPIPCVIFNYKNLL